MHTVQFDLTVEVGDPPEWLGAAFRSYCLDSMRPTADRLHVDLKKENKVQMYRCEPVTRVSRYLYRSAIVLLSETKVSAQLASSLRVPSFEIRRSSGPPRCRFVVRPSEPIPIPTTYFEPDVSDRSRFTWPVTFRSPTAFARWPRAHRSKVPPFDLLIQSAGHRYGGLRNDLNRKLHRDVVAILQKRATVLGQPNVDWVEPPRPAPLERGAVGSATYACDDLDGEQRLHVASMLNAAEVLGLGKKTTYGFGAFRYDAT